MRWNCLKHGERQDHEKLKIGKILKWTRWIPHTKHVVSQIAPGRKKTVPGWRSSDRLRTSRTTAKQEEGCQKYTNTEDGDDIVWKLYLTTKRP